MILTSKIVENETDAFVALPSEVLTALNVKAGDNLKFVQTDEGIVLTPCSQEFATAMKAGKQFMEKYPKAFEALAKS
jgi:putative addiction module antidote